MGRLSADADAVCEARVTDMLTRASAGKGPLFFGFLDEHEAALAVRIAKHAAPEQNWMLWGGCAGAERVLFGAFPFYNEPEDAAFPVTSLTASYRTCDHLSHRDFLGAFLHAGIERSTLGDILVEDGRCVLFCRNEIASFLCTQISKVGGVGVTVTQGAREPLPAAHRFQEFSAVVASSRLDCVVAAAAGIGRPESAEKIRSAQVMLNHETAAAPDRTVKEGDILSVRGEGRFVVDRVGPVTKKGRLSIAGRKYI